MKINTNKNKEQTRNTPRVPKDCDQFWKKISKEAKAINDSAVGHTHP